MEQQENNTNATAAAKNHSPIEAMRRYIESLPEDISFKEEITDYQFWKAVRTEFLATILLIVFGCGSCLSSISLPPKLTEANFTITNHFQTNQLVESDLIILEIKVSLVFGLTVATLVQCMGQVSGCHMNPAVTVSLLVTKRLTLLRCFMYIFAQCMGSIVACGIIYGLLNNEQRQSSRMGLTLPLDTLNSSQAFGYEFLGTFIVVLSFLVNTDTQRSDTGFKALSIGFTYTVAHLFAFRHTGAGLNPVRTFGPALFNGIWDYQWLYWVGPLIAGMLSGFTYEYIRSISSNECQSLKRSFRRRPSKGLKRDASSGISNNETEFTITSTEFPRY